METTRMNAVKQNLTEIGAKIQTGASEFAEKHELGKKVQPIKEKAGALTAKAGDAINGAKSRFAAMMEERKKKQQERAAEAGEESPKPQNEILNKAGTAVKNAFESAKKMSQEVAKKAGIGNGAQSTNNTEPVETAPKPEGEAETNPAEDL